MAVFFFLFFFPFPSQEVPNEHGSDVCILGCVEKHFFPRINLKLPENCPWYGLLTP